MGHEPTGKEVKANVNFIRYEFETKNVTRMSWIPEKCNPAYVVIKKDSPGEHFATYVDFW